MFVTGLVLAAGASRRLGQPKQLLAYRGGTLLDATLSTARDCRFDQLLVALGAAGDKVRSAVDLEGLEVVEVTQVADVVDDPQLSGGCSSSIGAAMSLVDPRADGLVLLLGDQPGISPDAVADLVADRTDSIAVCRYDNSLGHPIWFHRNLFAELGRLHGDKAVWKLMHSGRYVVREVPVEGPVPVDVDTWQDYETLLSQDFVQDLEKGATQDLTRTLP